MSHKSLIPNLHRYVGVFVGLLLAVLGLTGSALVFHQEIDHLLYPQIAHVNPVGEIKSLQQMKEIVQQQYPDKSIRYFYLKRKPDRPFHLVTRTTKGKKSNQTTEDIYINPYNGEILGIIPRNRSLMGIINLIHTSFLAGEPGKFLVGTCGILLFIRAISGLIIFPGWKSLRAGFIIRWKSRFHLLQYDFHKVIGIVSVIFLILAGTTGGIMEFSQHVRSVSYNISGIPQPKKPVSIRKSNLQAPTLDQFLEEAEIALPGGQSTLIFPAKNSTVPVLVRKRLEGDVHPNGRSFIYLDRYSGEVLKVENIHYALWVEKLMMWMYPLHIGSYGGVPTRILYVFLGLTPVALFFTGLVIFWNKTYGSKKKRKL